MIISRPATQFEKGMINGHINTQLGIEFFDSKDIPEFIQRIQDYTIGLHISFDKGNLIYHKRPLDVAQLPTNGISSIEDANEWIGPKMIDPSERLAYLAANDRFVVMNINHMAGDGISFVELVNKHLTSFQENEKINLPHFPEPVEVTFENEIKSTDMDYHLKNEGDITIAKSHQHIKDLPKPNINDFAKSHNFKSNNLMCYDKKQKKCHFLTEYLWTSLVLSMNAFESNYNPQFHSRNSNLVGPIGCSTCIDLRSLKNNDEIGIKNANTFGVIANSIPSNLVSQKMTVYELGQLMRKDFIDRKNKGEPFFFFHHTSPAFRTRIDGDYADLSQLSPFVIRDPRIKDAYATVFVRNKEPYFLSLLCQSVVKERKLREDEEDEFVFRGRLQYRQSTFTDKDSLIIMKSIKYFLNNVKLDRTVGDVLEEIKSFQKNISE